MNQRYETRISLIACGGAGIAMAREIDKARYGLHEIVAIDTDARSLQEAENANTTLLIATSDGKQPSSYLDAQRWATKQRDKIAEAIGRPHLVIVIAGLGGAAGTGISSVVGRTAREGGIPARAFATMPSALEGKARQFAGEEGFLELAEHCHNALAFPLGLMPIVNGGDDCIENAHLAKTGLEHYLENTCRSITRCSFVRNDFEDLQLILDQGVRGARNPSSTIGWGEASGPDRALQAAWKAVNHPLLFPRNKGEIGGISVAIRAHGGSLGLDEVKAVMNTVTNRYASSDTSIIFSADDDNVGDARMQVSIILNREPERGSPGLKARL